MTPNPIYGRRARAFVLYREMASCHVMVSWAVAPTIGDARRASASILGENGGDATLVGGADALGSKAESAVPLGQK